MAAREPTRFPIIFCCWNYLREVVGLTGTKTGCDGGECGACTVLFDDTPRLSCLTLAVSVEGRRIDTIESLAKDSHLSGVQRGLAIARGLHHGVGWTPAPQR
jgi:4-hydroxybenzoyl-CoA reductase subunit gamma